MKILVTGASGFIGSFLVGHLLEKGHSVVAAGRRPLSLGEEFLFLNEIESCDWHPVVKGVDCVIHLAAIAHARGVPVERLQAVNRDAAVRLAASLGHEQKFIFMSSIRAQGSGDGISPLVEDAPARPECDYGQMKLAAEQEIMRLRPDACVFRPVTVYGAGVKGGMRRLAQLLESGLPLPFAGLHQRRSYLSAEVLAAAISFAVTKSMSGLYNISDPEPLSLAEFARCYRAARGRGARLFTLPEEPLVAGAGILGLQELAKLAVTPLVASPRRIVEAGFSFPKSSSQQLIEAWAQSCS